MEGDPDRPISNQQAGKELRSISSLPLGLIWVKFLGRPPAWQEFASSPQYLLHPIQVSGMLLGLD